MKESRHPSTLWHLSYIFTFFPKVAHPNRNIISTCKDAIQQLVLKKITQYDCKMKYVLKLY